MSRRYGQVPLNLWRNPTFKKLSVNGKLAVLFFWCGQHSTSAGIGIVPDAYATSDFGWSLDNWIAARNEAETCGFIERDAETETVFVVDYLRCNKPQNKNHRAAVVGQISSIDCLRLRKLAETTLAELDTKLDRPGEPEVVSQRLKQIASGLGW